MLKPPTEGEFQTFELPWKNVYDFSRAQGYSVSTLRYNMTHNQIVIGCDRYGTPTSHKNTSKTVTSIKLDCPIKIYCREYAKSTPWTPKFKDPEHNHDATENIRAHPAFRRFNEEKIKNFSNG
ncbi:hypothetical protein O181_109864 [Austropuccinia psidii MF-1]|uniref:FAR1 domain-containing protein n=1 Tax=Austropuccinia psidii MF-1 TaxID=1389203 RepID=A0A9Q3JX90_9BASI|nr:hypothetical protein [Austropuccinia psidii MF-1]